MAASPRSSTGSARVHPLSSRSTGTGILFAALVVVSLNLRAPMASVPPVLSDIEADLRLTGGGAGLLTALPVLCMGLLAPASQQLAHRFGRERAITAALVLLTAGVLVRALPGGALPLYGGTLAAGAGIAVCGVVLPGVVKQYFPQRAGAATGAYVGGMVAGAATAAALSAPTESLTGSWRASLAVWAVLGLLGLAVWVPVMRGRQERAVEVSAKPLPWRSRTAWLVTAYLGAQSFGFYSALAWLAPAYQARGWSAEGAGLLLALFMGVQLAAGLALPALADRHRDRRPWFLLSVGCSALGVVGLLAHLPAVPVVAVMGFGFGGAFPLGLVLLVDYAPDPAASSRLTALAYLWSYGLAATGPVVLGVLRDATGAYTLPFLLLLAVTLVQAVLAARFTPGRQVRIAAERGTGPS